MSPIFSSTRDETHLTNNLCPQILCRGKINRDGDLSFLNDMRVFNRRGNVDSIGKLLTFWKAKSGVIDLDKLSGAHCHPNCSGNFDTTVNVSHASIFVSIPQLIEKNNNSLLKLIRIRNELNLMSPPSHGCIFNFTQLLRT